MDYDATIRTSAPYESPSNKFGRSICDSAVTPSILDSQGIEPDISALLDPIATASNPNASKGEDGAHDGDEDL